MSLDAGENTIINNHKIITNAKTIVWNGPIGVFENPLFKEGSENIVKSLM